MNTKFFEAIGVTPGPWKGLHGGGIDRRGNKHIYAAEPYGQICVLDKQVNDSNDSSVITAAPEMLEALIISYQHIIKSVDEVEGCPYDNCIKHSDGSQSCQYEDCIHYKAGDVIKKAIEKATEKTWPEIKKIYEETNS